jgi:hypothetical protein
MKFLCPFTFAITLTVIYISFICNVKADDKCNCIVKDTDSVMGHK